MVSIYIIQGHVCIIEMYITMHEYISDPPYNTVLQMPPGGPQLSTLLGFGEDCLHLEFLARCPSQSQMTCLVLFPVLQVFSVHLLHGPTIQSHVLQRGLNRFSPSQT